MSSANELENVATNNTETIAEKISEAAATVAEHVSSSDTPEAADTTSHVAEQVAAASAGEGGEAKKKPGMLRRATQLLGMFGKKEDSGAASKPQGDNASKSEAVAEEAAAEAPHVEDHAVEAITEEAHEDAVNTAQEAVDEAHEAAAVVEEEHAQVVVDNSEAAVEEVGGTMADRAVVEEAEAAVQSPAAIAESAVEEGAVVHEAAEEHAAVEVADLQDAAIAHTADDVPTEAAAVAEALPTEAEKRRVSFSEDKPLEHTYPSEQSQITEAATEADKPKEEKKGGFFGFLKKHPKTEAAAPAAEPSNPQSEPVTAADNVQNEAASANEIVVAEDAAAAVEETIPETKAEASQPAEEAHSEPAHAEKSGVVGGILGFLTGGGKKKDHEAEAAVAEQHAAATAENTESASGDAAAAAETAGNETPEADATEAVPSAENAVQNIADEEEAAPAAEESKDGSQAAAVAGGAAAAAAVGAGAVAAKKRGLCGMGKAEAVHDTSVICKQGQLNRQSRFLKCRFKPVHVRLLPDGTLQYSKTDVFCHAVDLGVLGASVDSSECKEKFLLTISGSGVKKTVFSAETVEDRDSWLAAIKELQGSAVEAPAESIENAEVTSGDASPSADQEEAVVEGPLEKEVEKN